MGATTETREERIARIREECRREAKEASQHRREVLSIVNLHTGNRRSW